jgi:hypothetical protein
MERNCPDPYILYTAIQIVEFCMQGVPLFVISFADSGKSENFID